jgi:PqqD family protein of HPr-rel-A system
MHDEPMWRPAAPDAIAWREWEGEVVLYNHATGDTHHLDPLGGRVMLSLLRHPAGIGMRALLQEVSAGFETEALSRLAAEVDRVLADLAGAQLAERCGA